MKLIAYCYLLIHSLFPIVATASGFPVFDQVVHQQRIMLQKNTEGSGFGPQSPRDIDSLNGNNPVIFSAAPSFTQMNLCNIHFHKNAEHKGGEFTKFAGNGDDGFSTGYQYSGQLTDAELAPVDAKICSGKHGSLNSGDTIEVHYVYTTAYVNPGPTLGACFNDATKNPQLRVETQIYVLVNDSNASNFVKLTSYKKQNGFYQAVNIPDNTGTPVQYLGSTTGPAYNELGSPFQVTWQGKRMNIF